MKQKPSEGKLSVGTEAWYRSFNEEQRSQRPNGSHGMTLNRPFGVKEVEEKSFSTSIEYHLTIQISNESLTRRDLSLLLDVLNYQACNFGVNFVMLMGMYELYFRLLGNKSDPKELVEPHIRLTLTVTDKILRVLRNVDFSLYPGEVVILPSKLVSLLRNGLMTKRTYGSRYRTWRPEKFMRVRIVPVDIQFLNRRKDTLPYSSYCKGYGESHPNAHRQRLRENSETDGYGPDPTETEEIYLFNRCTNPIHVLCEFLEIRYKNEEQEIQL